MILIVNWKCIRSGATAKNRYYLLHQGRVIAYIICINDRWKLYFSFLKSINSTSASEFHGYYASYEEACRVAEKEASLYSYRVLSERERNML